MSSIVWHRADGTRNERGPRQERQWRGPNRCRGRSRCSYFAWKAQMASDEIKKNFEAVTEPSLSRWVQVLAWIIVPAGVCWCVYATWCEETAASTTVGTIPMRDLTLFCTNPEIGRWLPASGALASVTAGIGALASGRSSTRFLVAAAALVTAKALTLVIE